MLHSYSLGCSTQINDKAMGKLADKLEKVEQQLAEHPMASMPDLRSRLAELQRKRGLQEQAKVGLLSPFYDLVSFHQQSC